eukprot:1153920-Pelagomonas_calceolata.AAC.2
MGTQRVTSSTRCLTSETRLSEGFLKRASNTYEVSSILCGIRQAWWGCERQDLAGLKGLQSVGGGY